MEVSYKHALPYYPAIPILGIYTSEIKDCLYTDTHIAYNYQVFIVALLIITKNWK